MMVHVLYLVSLLVMPLVCQAAVSAAEQAEFLKVHNDYRSALAKGQYGGPATDMQEVQWDADLAAAAQAWADTCAGGHDSNSARQTASKKTSYVGQNAAWGYGTIAAAAQGWWDEYKCTVYPSGVAGGYPIASCNCAMCGHFTQMAWTATTHIGCGINTRCSSKTYFCNYYPGGNFDWGGRQDYVFRPGQACTNCAASGGSASQSCNNGLCSNGVAQPTNPVTPRPTTNPVSGPQPTGKPVVSPTPRPVSTSGCPTESYNSGYWFYWYPSKLNGNQRIVEAAWASIPYGGCFKEVKITYTPDATPGWYDKIEVGGTSGYFWGTSAMINDLKNNMNARQKAIEDYVKARVGASGTGNQGSRPAAPASSEGCSPSPCNGASSSGNESKKVNVGLVVGIVIGSIAACCLMAGVVYCIMQQHKQKTLYQNEERLLGEQAAYQPPIVS